MSAIQRMKKKWHTHNWNDNLKMANESTNRKCEVKRNVRSFPRNKSFIFSVRIEAINVSLFINEFNQLNGSAFYVIPTGCKSQLKQRKNFELQKSWLFFSSVDGVSSLRCIRTIIRDIYIFFHWWECNISGETKDNADDEYSNLWLKSTKIHFDGFFFLEYSA